MKSIAAIQRKHGEDMILDEIDIPDPGAEQVGVKLFSSGICHSQLYEMGNLTNPRPRVFGHEGTGIVTAIGKNVTHIKEGDHCIITWVPGPYTKGRPDKTPPGATYKNKLVHCAWSFTWSEYSLVNSEYVVPIPKDEPVDISCIVGCAVLTGAGAVLNTAQLKPSNSIAVFGMGGVGLSAINMAAILGGNPIIAIDLDEKKLEFSKTFGATHLINAKKNDPVQAIHDITHGGVDYAIDAVGIRQTNEQILESTRGGGPGAANIGGTSILIGMPGKEMTLNPELFMQEQRIYRGSLGAAYPETDFPMYLRLYREKKFHLDKLVTHRYKFKDVVQGYKDLDAGEILGRAIIEY